MIAHATRESRGLPFAQASFNFFGHEIKRSDRIMSRLFGDKVVEILDAPDLLLSLLRPRYVIASHWENFFRQQTLPLELNPASDVDAFMTVLSNVLPAESGWIMPLPRSSVRVAVVASGDAASRGR